MMKKKKRWILATVLFALILSFSQAHTQDKETKAEYYRRMSEILLRYDPGIDYPALHERYRQSRPVQPFWHEMEFSIKPKKGLGLTDINKSSPILIYYLSLNSTSTGIQPQEKELTGMSKIFIEPMDAQLHWK